MPVKEKKEKHLKVSEWQKKSQFGKKIFYSRYEKDVYGERVMQLFCHVPKDKDGNGGYVIHKTFESAKAAELCGWVKL